jgi:hypothetical protein
VPKIKNRKKKPTFILELKVARKQNYKENKLEFQIKKRNYIFVIGLVSLLQM